MRARDAFDRTTARLLAQRVKKKFTNSEEDIANVRVMANGVAATGGQVYNADVAGHRPGTVVKAVNVGSKAKAHYVAQFGNSDGNGLLGENDVKRMIEAALEGLSQNELKQITSTPPTSTPSGSDPSMTVTPEDNISATGFVGATFTGSQVYTLTNTGTASLVWTVIKGRPWVDLSATTGTLAASATTTVTVSINATEAALLTKGEYLDLIIFNAVNA